MISGTAIGNVGSAELSDARGTPILRFSVASTRRQRGKEDQTTWVRCAIFGKRAEGLANFIVKGARVAVAGTMYLSQYTTKNGEVRTDLELDAKEVELLGRPGDRGRGRGDEGGSEGGDDIPW